MKRNPLYVAIRRNALMSAGALAVTAGGAITAISMAQAAETDVATDITLTTVSATVGAQLGAPGNDQLETGSLTATTSASPTISATGTPAALDESDNLIFAEIVGNELEVDSGVVDLANLSNGFTPDGAGIASGQLLAPTGDSSASVTGASITADIGFVTDQTVDILRNRITADVQGNTADVTLGGDVPNDFSSTTNGAISLTDGGTGILTSDDQATLSISSQQVTDGFEAPASGLATNSNGLVELIHGNAGNMDSTVTVEENQIDATARGNDAVLATNIGDGDGLTAFDGTLATSSVQVNSGLEAVSTTTGGQVRVTLDSFVGIPSGNGAIDGGNVSVSDNLITAVAQGNRSAISQSADDTISMLGGGTTVSRSLDDIAGTLTLDSDIGAATVQSNVDSTISATTDGTSQHRVFLGTIVNGGVLDVNDNGIVAQAEGNRASTEFDFSGTQFGDSLSGSTSQFNSNTDIAASVSAPSNIIADFTGGTSPNINGSLNLDDNLISAQVRGNVASSSATISPTSGVNSTTSIDASTLINSAAETVNTEGDLALITTQENTTGAPQFTATLGGAEVRVVGVDDLTGTLSADGNSLLAEARGNRATSDLTVEGSSVEASASITSGQVNDAVDLAADATDSQVVDVELGGAIADAVASLDDNLIGAQAIGSQANSTLSVTSGVNIDQQQSVNSSVGTSPTAARAEGGSALANLQRSEGGSITASVDAAPDRIRLNAAGATVSDSALSLSDNAILAEGRGTRATNEIALAAGTDIDSGAGLANAQAIDGTPITVTAEGLLVALSGAPSVTDSAVTLDGNLLAAVAGGNSAANAITAEAGNAITGVVSAPASFSSPTALGQFALRSRQDLVDDTSPITATLTDAEVDATLGALSSQAAVSVSDNTLAAEATGNQATNLIGAGLTEGGPDALLAANAIGATAVINAAQLSDVAVNASASDTTVDVGTGTIDAASLSVEGNLLGALATGNTQTNGIAASAGTGISPLVQPQASLALSTGTASYLVRSDSSQNADVTATTEDALVELTFGAVSDEASVDLDGNAILSQARGTNASNSVALDAGTSIAASGGIVNEQQVNGNIQAHTTLDAAASNAIDLTGASITNGSVSVTENVIAAQASGNTGANRLSADAATNIDLGSGGTATTDGTAETAVADFAILSDQDASASPPTTATAYNENALLDLTVGNITDNGVLEVMGNDILASAQLNQVINQLALTSGTSATTSGAILNSQSGLYQPSVTPHGSEIGTALISVTSGTVTEGRIEASGNEIASMAGGNLATNVLTVTAGTEVASTGTLARADVFDATANAVSADYAVQSNQTLNGGDSILGAGISTGAGITLSTDLTSGVATIADNVIEAGVTGNDATNVLALNGESGVAASGGVANVQSVGFLPMSALVESPDMSLTNSGGSTVARLALDGNRMEASSTANRALNAIEVTSGTGISGSGNSAVASASGAASDTLADFAVLNRQSSGSAVTATLNNANMDIDGGTMGSGRVSLDNNRMVASATGNSAINRVTLASGTRNASSMGVTNSQFNSGSISASVDGATMSSDVTGGVSSVRGNSIGASAVGNSASSRLSSSR